MKGGALGGWGLQLVGGGCGEKSEELGYCREGAGYSSLDVGVSALLAKVPPSLESITLKLHPGLKLPESMWGLSRCLSLLVLV